MKIQPQEITDRLGNKIIIREGEITDSESLQKCVKSYLKSQLIPLTEVEFEEMAKNHKEWIQRFKDGKNDLLLVADYNGKSLVMLI